MNINNIAIISGILCGAAAMSIFLYMTPPNFEPEMEIQRSDKLFTIGKSDGEKMQSVVQVHGEYFFLSDADKDFTLNALEGWINSERARIGHQQPL
jgi:hypothetical protein